MQIRYVGPHDAVTVGTQSAVRDGDPIEVQDEKVAKALVDRGDFEQAGKAAPKNKTEDK